MIKKFLSQKLNSHLYQDSSLVLLSNLAGAGLNLVSTAIVARSISKEALGAFALFVTISGFGGIFLYPGLNATLNKAALLNQGHFIKKYLKKTFLRALLLMAIGLFSFSIILKMAQKIPELPFFPLGEETILCFYASILCLPILSLERSEIILSGTNKFKLLASYKIVSSLLNSLLVAGIVFYYKTLSALLIATLLSRLFAALIGLYFYRHHLHGGDGPTEEKLEAQTKELSWLTISQNVASVISRTYIYHFSAVSLALYYTGSNVPMKIKDYIKTILFVPLQFWLKKGGAKYGQQVEKFKIPFLLLGLAVTLGHCLIAPYYVPLVYGEKYHDAVIIAQIMSFGIFPSVIGFILESREIIHEDTRFYQRLSYVRMFCGLAGLFPLVYFWQEKGFALNLVLNDYIGIVALWRRFRAMKKDENNDNVQRSSP